MPHQMRKVPASGSGFERLSGPKFSIRGLLLDPSENCFERIGKLSIKLYGQQELQDLCNMREIFKLLSGRIDFPALGALILVLKKRKSLQEDYKVIIRGQPLSAGWALTACEHHLFVGEAQFLQGRHDFAPVGGAVARVLGQAPQDDVAEHAGAVGQRGRGLVEVAAF